MTHTLNIVGYNVLCPWQLAIIKLITQVNTIVDYERYVIKSFHLSDNKPNHLTQVIIHTRSGPTLPLERLIPTIDTITCEQLSFFLAGFIEALKDTVENNKK